MKILGKSILILALFWFALSLYAIFWPSTVAYVIEKSNISLSQNGYSNVSKSGVSTFKGGSTTFNIVSYRYTVSEVIYEGKGNIKPYGSSIEVYYCPIYPAFSLTKNSIPVLWLILFCIIGFSFLEIGKWLLGLQKQKNP
jgi:hypothetical protein